MLTSNEFIITQLLSDINTLHTIWTEYITFRALTYHPSICINACSFLTNTGILHAFIDVYMKKHMIFISTPQSHNNTHFTYVALNGKNCFLQCRGKLPSQHPAQEPDLVLTTILNMCTCKSTSSSTH